METGIFTCSIKIKQPEIVSPCFNPYKVLLEKLGVNSADISIDDSGKYILRLGFFALILNAEFGITASYPIESLEQISKLATDASELWLKQLPDIIKAHFKSRG